MKAVNLLPSEHRGVPAASPASKPGAPGGSPVGAYAVLGALALAVVMAAAYVLVGNSVKDRQAELASVRAESQQIRAQADALKPYADFRQLAVQRVATVTQLAQSRFDWERALRDVSRALPADVHLKSFKGSVTGSTDAAAAPQPGATVTPAILLTGCTNSQAAVAKLMARLRAVRGVTRVSLTKSEKPTAASTPTSGGGLSRPCYRTSEPDFELKMHFERAAVAPTVTAPAQPGAASAVAAATTPPADPAQPAPAGQASPAAQPPAPGASAPSTTQGVSTP